MCIPACQLNSVHDRFLALLPKIELHGRIFFRHLKPHKKEKVLQDMRALAWKWFVRLAQRGKDAAEFISTFNSFLARAVRNGRQLWRAFKEAWERFGADEDTEAGVAA